MSYLVVPMRRDICGLSGRFESMIGKTKTPHFTFKIYHEYHKKPSCTYKQVRKFYWN